jgi:hypothetical protein
MQVQSEADANVVAARFGGFHDAFFRRIAIASDDFFHPDGGHVFAGVLTITLDIVRESIDTSDNDPHRIVRVIFYGVRDIALCFRGRECEWSIHQLTFHAHNRVSATGEPEACLVAPLAQNVLDEREAWRLVVSDIFTFTDAVLAEHLAA